MEETKALVVPGDAYLAHYGVKGMKWGVRRYRKENGKLTPAGRAKLAKYKERELKRLDKHSASPKDYDKILTKVALNELKADRADKGGKPKKAEKYRDFSRYQLVTFAAAQKMKAAQEERIRSMTFDQMTAEKKRIGKERITEMLTFVGANAILYGTTGYVMAPIGLRPDNATIKADMRVDPKKQNRIYEESETEMDEVLRRYRRQS